MTGEMSESEVTRDRFPALFKLKDEIRRRFDVDVEARPFDQYQGAYLRIDNRIKVWMDGDGGKWKTGSLENQWYFEGVEYEDTIHGGSGVYQMLEAEGYTRKSAEYDGYDNDDLSMMQDIEQVVAESPGISLEGIADELGEDKQLVLNYINEPYLKERLEEEPANQFRQKR